MKTKKLTKVEQSIYEHSDKIEEVKKIVQAYSSQSTSENIKEENISDKNWKNMKFSQPDKIVRLGTLFSGIGAIELAFQRLNLNHKIERT